MRAHTQVAELPKKSDGSYLTTLVLTKNINPNELIFFFFFNKVDLNFTVK